MENNFKDQNEIEQTNLLEEEFNELNSSYTYASQAQRFLNWLIDNVFMRFALTYLTGMGIGLLLSYISPDFLNEIVEAEYNGRRSFSIVLFSLFISYSNYILYYTLCETLFKGYTLGKIITGTRAIQQNGDELTFKKALYRSLSRCVPFEVFSGFSTLTWHDSWTDTMVIKSR